MPWGAAAAVIGAGASYASSSSAAGKQQNAADAATAAQQNQYDTTRSDNMPALNARNNALSQMQTAINGFGSGMPTADQVMATPGYQFGLTQGANSLQNAAAASSGIYSGAVGKALARYGTDYATTKYDDAFNNMQTADNNTINRLGVLANGGQPGASTIANTGNITASNEGQIGMSNATNQGAAGIAQANQWGSLASTLGSYWNTPNNSSSNNPNSIPNLWGNRSYVTDPSSAGAQNGMDVGGWSPMTPAPKWADGGPVRIEPVIGSRTPLPTPTGGGAGGLTTNALQALLMARLQPAAPAASGVALPPNYLMNPQLIQQMRMQQAGEYADGGPVRGPGGPRDDAIPVPMDGGGIGHLSNNEHVFDVPAVLGAGNGNVEQGHMVLNKLRQILQAAGAQHV